MVAGIAMLASFAYHRFFSAAKAKGLEDKAHP